MSAYLVTGGLGFLGAPLVKALVRDGHRVRVLDNGSRGSAANLGDVRADVELMEGDVRDGALVRRAVQGVDGVCHLASVNGTRNFYERPAHVLDVGVKGMVAVLDACMQAGVGELFLASSSEVYQTPPSIPTDETAPLSVPDPLNPRYSYGGQKIISELMALHYGQASFQRVVIVRPHNVFGPNMGEDHVIPQLIRRLLALKASQEDGEIQLPIQGSGDQTRAFIYVEDFIAAMKVLFDRGEHLHIYHVGTMDERTIRDVAVRIAECLQARIRLVPGAGAPGGPLRRCPDTRKLQALGFQPRWSFEEGLRNTVAWYASHAPIAVSRPTPEPCRVP